MFQNFHFQFENDFRLNKHYFCKDWECHFWNSVRLVIKEYYLNLNHWFLFLFYQNFYDRLEYKQQMVRSIKQFLLYFLLQVELLQLHNLNDHSLIFEWLMMLNFESTSLIVKARISWGKFLLNRLRPRQDKWSFPSPSFFVRQGILIYISYDHERLI